MSNSQSRVNAVTHTPICATVSPVCVWASGEFLIPHGDPSLVLEPKNIVLTNGYEARGIRTESHKLDMRMALTADVMPLFNWSVKEVRCVTSLPSLETLP